MVLRGRVHVELDLVLERVPVRQPAHLVLRGADPDLAHGAPHGRARDAALGLVVVRVVHLKVGGVVEALVVGQVAHPHPEHVVAGLDVGVEGRVLQLAGEHRGDVLLGREPAGVVGVAGDPPPRDHASQVEALHDLAPRAVEPLRHALAPVLRVHRDVGAVQRLRAGIVGGEAAGGGDLVVGVPGRVVVQVHDQRHGVADDHAPDRGDRLPFGERVDLHLEVALGAEPVLGVAEVGGLLDGEDRGHVRLDGAADLDRGGAAAGGVGGRAHAREGDAGCGGGQGNHLEGPPGPRAGGGTVGYTPRPFLEEPCG